MMNNFFPTSSGSQRTPITPIPESLKSQDKPLKKEPGLLRWWYRIASPPLPLGIASFKEKDIFRRGRTGSQITIVIFLLLLFSYPAAFAGSNSLLILILTADLIVMPIAVILNRFGKVNLAGFLVVLCVLVSPTMNILTTPGGLNASTLPIFGLLVFPLICAASFLPPRWVFGVALGNCLFTLYVLMFWPSVGELHELLKVALPGIVTPIILSQVIVSLVAFLWVRGAEQALLRADQAEEIAKLKAAEVRRQEEQLAISKQIEEGIQQIIATMSVVVTQNDFRIRVPLSQKNILWRVGMSINNLLSRLQVLKQSQEEVKRTYAVAAEIVQLMRNQQPIRLQSWTGTSLDPIIIEYNKLLRNASRPLVENLSAGDPMRF